MLSWPGPREFPLCGPSHQLCSGLYFLAHSRNLFPPPPLSAAASSPSLLPVFSPSTGACSRSRPGQEQTDTEVLFKKHFQSVLFYIYVSSTPLISSPSRHTLTPRATPWTSIEPGILLSMKTYTQGPCPLPTMLYQFRPHTSVLTTLVLLSPGGSVCFDSWLVLLPALSSLDLVMQPLNPSFASSSTAGPAYPSTAPA